MAKKARSTEKVKYGEAVEEIEHILESIDQDEIDIDDLSDKVERAVQLIRVCQDKLRATETRVNQALEGLQDLQDDDDSPAADEKTDAPSTSADGEEDLPF